MLIAARESDVVSELGLQVLGDIEANATRAAAAGEYDAALLIESLTHIQDKPALLRWLRTQTKRLVLRVNTRPGTNIPAGTALLGPIFTILTALSCIFGGLHRRKLLRSPACAQNWPISC